MTSNPNHSSAYGTLPLDDEFNSPNVSNETPGTGATDDWYAPPNGNSDTLTANGEQQWYIASTAATQSLTSWAIPNGSLSLVEAAVRPANQQSAGAYQAASSETDASAISDHDAKSTIFNPDHPSAHGTLTFDDEFNSLSLWNGTSGTWATDYWYDPLNGNGNTLAANGEQEWYINANDPATASVTPWTVSNGVMTLTAAPASPTIQPLINGYQYTSGEINTSHTFSQLYGFFEMKAELPAGQGLWPAFWLLPENGAWPPELDIMEVLGSAPTVLYTTAHSVVNGQDVSNGIGTTVVNTSTSFNTYAVDWEPNTITWYFDGNEVYQIATPADMHTPMFIEANLAVGGYWPGDVNSSTPLPAEMKIDWIRAYAANPGIVLAADNTPGEHLVNANFGDTFYAGDSSVMMAGAGGGDTFVFNVVPQIADCITDFVAGDTLDLSALFATTGYHGTDPTGAGFLTFVETEAGNAQVYFDPDGSAGPDKPVLITTLDHVAASSLNDSDFVIANGTTAGQTLTANGTADQVLTGTPGNDTFYAENNSVIMTGGGGSDTFVFNELPTSAGQITDFNPASDKLDLSALFEASGYHGSNPVGDGYLQFVATANGSTQVYFDPDGSSNPGAQTLITTLDNVAPTSINVSTDIYTGIGATYTANNAPGQVLAGIAGNDTFYAGENSVTMTGGSEGSDTFVFNDQPWNSGQITNFNPALDKIDVTALLAIADYHGTTPFTDGILSVTPDLNGDTLLYFHPDGAGSSTQILITTLDNVLPSSLNLTSDFVI
jgi:beta-glucanase (GH16 family)